MHQPSSCRTGVRAGGQVEVRHHVERSENVIQGAKDGAAPHSLLFSGLALTEHDKWIEWHSWHSPATKLSDH